MAKELIDGAKRGNIFELKPEDIMIVGLDTPAEQYPHLVDEDRVKRPVEESLVLSIMAMGVLQPIKVVVYGGVPYAVDGRQRIRAAREANKRIKEIGDGVAREKRPEVSIRAEATNGARVSEDLLARSVVAMNVHVESDLLEKARKAEQLRARGISDADIAIAFGVTVQAIRDWARLSGLAKPVLDAVRDGRLSAHAAAELADLPRAEQVQKLEEILASGIKPTAKNVRQNVKPEPSGEPRPSGRTVNKLLKVVAEREDLELSPDFILALRWMRGEVSTKKIKGLSALLRELEAPKEKTE